ncbi:MULTISPECIES: hypothetical protein [Pseudanabaena]|uniref:PIN domain-containing protein n=2 Tax=Pseudanabaena TaxID=1152 RepID=L8N6V7_9CYAN|nr:MULTISPECIES: hypothetical protein [Pseudanabaena]ELS34839.1 hypothetical protein Pse7429DRAFT_0028 [Pseudanabaena biceps PCC 7429]MDG3492961.1 hypothetical protein [Pseudanabaena catenata USMAC16]
MTITLNVQADVVDINSDTPQPSDIFLVDTNIWLWQTYSRYSVPNLAQSALSLSSSQDLRRLQRKIAKYLTYIKKASITGAILVYSELMLSELAHVIETTEFKIYQSRNNLAQLTLKEYRNNFPTERSDVVDEVQSVWRQVEQFAVPANLMVNNQVAQSALTRFETQSLDGYDLFIIEAINRAGAGQVRIITDDQDYVTVNNIQVFTANGNAISNARRLNKLLVR